MSIERSPSGTQRTLDAPLLTFDLAVVLAEMKRERTWETASRDAITLLKTRGLRVVLIALHGGAVVPSHRTDGAITVQVLAGRLMLETAAGNVPLSAGHLLTLQSDVAHGIEALDDCALLLTIGSDGLHPAEARGDACAGSGG